MRGRLLVLIGTLAAYALPAAGVWWLLGAMLSVDAIAALAGAALLAYSVVFGFAEIAASSLVAPTLRWQVPGSWVALRHPVLQTAVWGATLGPGLMTRNPYAGMWGVPMLIALSPEPVLAGIFCGAAHGFTRASGVLANAWGLGAAVERILVSYYWWRGIDGLFLLFVAGFIAIWSV